MLQLKGTATANLLNIPLGAKTLRLQRLLAGFGLLTQTPLSYCIKFKQSKLRKIKTFNSKAIFIYKCSKTNYLNHNSQAADQ